MIRFEGDWQERSAGEFGTIGLRGEFQAERIQDRRPQVLREPVNCREYFIGLLVEGLQPCEQGFSRGGYITLQIAQFKQMRGQRLSQVIVQFA